METLVYLFIFLTDLGVFDGEDHITSVPDFSKHLIRYSKYKPKYNNIDSQVENLKTQE